MSSRTIGGPVMPSLQSLLDNRLTRLLHHLPAESAHDLAVAWLERGWIPHSPGPPAEAGTVVAGLHLPSPVGIAAGFDKDARTLRGVSRLGLGFIEIGTLTPRPQPGNPKPRLFRLPEDRAVINRMGFNNGGLDAAIARLIARPRGRLIVGGNVGRNKDSTDAIADYVTGVSRLGPVVDYLVVNVSSPNTPGLRDLQEASALRQLLSACVAARDSTAPKRPLFVKLAPDLDDEALAGIAEVLRGVGIDGAILTNTTIDRPEGLKGTAKGETGGLSGAPLEARAEAVLRTFYRLTGGRLPLIGAGGIDSAETAYRRLRAGASAVQLYSALVYQGPGLPSRIARELPALAARDGFQRLTDAIGADHR